jgi:hypothetical protein
MSELIIHHETAIRLGFFAGVFIVVAIWETLAPRRALTVSKYSVLVVINREPGIKA